MLNILGREGRFCDGIPRRTFMKIGGLALGGLSMPQILRAEAKAGIRSSNKAIIMIFLPGGPPHQDMWDLKPDAPSEIRGEFKSIKTNVPGIEICEHFPRLAGMMDRLVAIRSIVGSSGRHDSYQCMTGRGKRNAPQGGWPSLGAVLSRLEGPGRRGVPPFMGLAPKMGHIEWADPGGPGFLGPAHSAFKPTGEGKADMTLQGITLARLNDRRALLAAFDRFRSDMDQSGTMEGMDAFYDQAMGVLTSSKLAEALDLSREDPRVRDRYGHGFNENKDDGGPRTLHQFLLARRLVEAGVRCVTLAFSRWDWHNNTFKQGSEEMPLLDQAVSALVEDLHQRGLQNDVSVVVWGEFGRTPKINNKGGRDHWPKVSCGLLACGGMRTGQVIGSTDRQGGEVRDRPVHFGEVFATLYQNLGIDSSVVTVPDLTGRPRHLVDSYRPLPELV